MWNNMIRNHSFTFDCHYKISYNSKLSIRYKSRTHISKKYHHKEIWECCISFVARPSQQYDTPVHIILYCVHVSIYGYMPCQNLDFINPAGEHNVTTPLQYTCNKMYLLLHVYCKRDVQCQFRFKEVLVRMYDHFWKYGYIITTELY